MYTPKFSTKRVLSLAMASALAVTGVVVVAGSSEAATPSISLSPKTGPSASATQVITVTGKAFMSGTTLKVGDVEFSTATCTAAAGGTQEPATSFNVVSSTKLAAITPVEVVLAASATSTNWNLCVYNLAGTALLGAGKYVVYAAPTVTSYLPVSGSSLGGGTVTLIGTNFSKASVVTIDAVKAKTTFIDSTGLTAVVPAHLAGTGYSLKVSTEGGTVTSGTTFTYVPTVKVSPAAGDGTDQNVISLTGTGFNNLTFAAAAATEANKANIYLVRAATTTIDVADIGLATTPTGGFPCLSVTVESDTALSCKLPTIAVATAGAYNAVVLVSTGTAGTIAASSTGYSTSSTYTVAAF